MDRTLSKDQQCLSQLVIGLVAENNLQRLEVSNINQKLTELVQENQSIKALLLKLVKQSSISDHFPIQNRKRRYWFLNLALIIVMTALIILGSWMILFNLLGPSSASDDTVHYPYAPEPSPPDHDSSPSDATWKIITRKQWGGRPAVSQTQRLIHPTSLVVIAHTATPKCTAFLDCSLKMRSIQDFHVARGGNDISYNFLVGGDGDVYEGRGWDVASPIKEDSISVAFVGNFVYERLDGKMINAARKLLKEGVKSGYLSEQYVLVAHNQTINTLSPGPHVYEEIQTWPHFKKGVVV